MTDLEDPTWPGLAYCDDALALLSLLRSDPGLIQKLKGTKSRGDGDSTLSTLRALIEGFSGLLADSSDKGGDEEGALPRSSYSKGSSSREGDGDVMEVEEAEMKMLVEEEMEKEVEEEKGGDASERDVRRGGAKRRLGGTEQDAKHDDDDDDDDDCDENDLDSDLECVSVIIIGASASGLGVASALLSASPDLDVAILESSSDVGASFADWPPFTRFISPSFYSNPFGCLDLNQITPTDAGVQATQVLQHEHPTGQDYATYLRTISRTTSYGGSPLRSRVVFGSYVSEVERLEWAGRMAFRVATSDGAQRYARYVIYAGGEFGHPYEPPNLTTEEGATVHYSKVRDWASYVEAGRAVVVGGGEAGFDAALYLIAEIEAGEVVVVARGGGEGKAGRVDDPSTTLTPVTKARLQAALQEFGNGEGKKKLTVLRGCECTAVNLSCGGPDTGFLATVKDKHGNTTEWLSPLPVVLATGFSLGSSPSCVLRGLSDWDDTGRPILSPDCDEVEKTKGLFVVGPMVKHTVDVGHVDDGLRVPSCAKIGGLKTDEREMLEPEDVIFCFIYKFRCRFALVAGEILSRLIAEYHAVDSAGDGSIVVDQEGHRKLAEVERMCQKWKDRGMLVTDLSCAVCGKVEGSC